MRLAVAIALTTAWLLVAHAKDQDHQHAIVLGAPSETLITITINPEARVSASRSGEPQKAIPCEHPMELPVKIINHGFVTASLEVSFVDSIPHGISLVFSAEPLKGIKEEHRSLRVTMKEPGIADVTIAFRAKNDISDLGGRDRIHLLLRCT
jgi:hypothetical protein